MFELILVRHGQTPCTVEGRFCGRHEARLTPVGQRMAVLAARHPRLDRVDRVVTSPARRAAETAAALGGARSVPVTTDPRLQELSFGEWESRLPAEVDPDTHQAWERDPALCAPPGGETALEVLARAVACVRDEQAAGGSVAIVSHKAPIRLILCFFLGLSPSRYRDLGNVTVGSVSALRLTARGVSLTALGDVAHLPAPWRADPDRATTGPDSFGAALAAIRRTAERPATR